MRFTRVHLWAGLLLGAALQAASSSCLFPGCPDEPIYIVFEDGSYIPGESCEVDGALVTLEDDVLHIDYVAEDGHEYRVIYDVVDREWK